MNAGAAKSGALGQRTRGPVGCVGGPGLQRQCEDTLHILVAQLARGAGPLLVKQAIDAVGQKALPPLAGRVLGGRELLGNGGIAQSVGSQQNDPRPHGQSLCGGAPSAPADQLLAVLRGNRQRR